MEDEVRRQSFQDRKVSEKIHRHAMHRYTLGYKNIPFRTVWVEYPDIAPLCKKIGASPTSVKPDGTPLYTLPVIHDPSTGKSISDSWDIARYLDEKYPGKPLLLQGTRALQWSFTVAASELVFDHIRRLIIFQTWAQLRPKSQPYWRATREAQFGCKLEDVSAGSAREEHWETAEKSLHRVATWLQKNGEDNTWVMGDNISFVDLFIGGKLAWVRQVDPEVWERVKRWDDGTWERYLDRLDSFTVFDEGEEYRE
jgi:glutathione S-transferase